MYPRGDHEPFIEPYTSSNIVDTHGFSASGPLLEVRSEEDTFSTGPAVLVF